MEINIREIVTFLDAPQDNERHHVSSVIGIIGEDLNASAFVHYLRRKNPHATVIENEKPVQGKRPGKWLDRWIDVCDAVGVQTLFQCEIKNWSGAAFNGYTLGVGCEEKDLRELAVRRWQDQVDSFDKPSQPTGTTKVLLKMQPPEGYEGVPIRPALLYWMPVQLFGDPDLKPAFEVPIQDLRIPDSLDCVFEKNDKLLVFSVSMYLRQLLQEGSQTIDLDMPDAEKRIEILSRVCRQ